MKKRNAPRKYIEMNICDICNEYMLGLLIMQEICEATSKQN